MIKYQIVCILTELQENKPHMYNPMGCVPFCEFKTEKRLFNYNFLAVIEICSPSSMCKSQKWRKPSPGYLICNCIQLSGRRIMD